MTLLSVNINKIALIRNSRGKNLPDVGRAALEIVKFGADGITLHPRPDERHARKSDVFELKKLLSVELNVEGYPSEDFMKMIERAQPAQCTLVPDPPHVLTSNAGWSVERDKTLLQEVAKRLKKAGTRVSVFIDPFQITEIELDYLKSFGVDRIELYTEKYANDFFTEQREATTLAYLSAARWADERGLGVNAGHDLNLDNLNYFIRHIPFIKEVSIGHALVCDALYLGLEKTVSEYKKCLTV